MRSLLIAGVLAATTCASAHAAEPDSEATREAPDLLTFARGAVLVHASVNPGGALDLINGDLADQRWRNNGKKEPPPYVFVFELLSPTVLERVAVNTSGKRPGGAAGSAARTVDIAASASGPEEGFTQVGTVRVEEDGEASVSLPPGEAVRWLRFTVRDNHGNEAFTYLDEVLAFGRQEPVPDDDERFEGTYDTNYGYVELHQDGAHLTGCFEGGTLDGDAVRGVARLSWRNTKSPDVRGTALFVKDARGELAGIRYRHKSRAAWSGPAKPLETPCSEPAEASNPIGDALATTGEVILYGIYFDFDKDILRPESEPTLRSLAAALNATPEMNVNVEGHTDALGSDPYNLDLSRRRASAVVAWLGSHGVDASRLSPVGMGESDPVADNRTADGRALNRRVEVVARP